MVGVAVYTEGPTEWYVTRKLWQRKILNELTFINHDSEPGKMIIGEVKSALKKLLNGDTIEITGYLITPPSDRILLMFDQEKMSSPSDVKDELEKHIQRFNPTFEFHPHNEFSNVFTGKLSIQENLISIAIHVAEKEFCLNDRNKDFDGYILELLKNETGQSIIRQILTDNKIIKLSKLREIIENDPDFAGIVHKLGEKDIPSLIESNNWPILRSKTILYSYITALQIGKSHVWLCEKVIDKADEQNLRTVFASLIAAWDELCRGG